MNSRAWIIFLVASVLPAIEGAAPTPEQSSGTQRWPFTPGSSQMGRTGEELFERERRQSSWGNPDWVYWTRGKRSSTNSVEEVKARVLEEEYAKKMAGLNKRNDANAKTGSTSSSEQNITRKAKPAPH